MNGLRIVTTRMDVEQGISTSVFFHGEIKTVKLIIHGYKISCVWLLLNENYILI